MKNAGLYIHIPFCKSKCLYCDFNSYAKSESLIEPYFSALFEEIKIQSRRYHKWYDTVYFGGGTPTVVDPEHICDTLSLLKQCFEITSDAEITAECNPKTIDFDRLVKLKNAGINRLSIGLQSTHDAFLQKLGRIHSFEDFKECFQNARAAGFKNISLDLMYGLPDMTLSDWGNTLDEAVDFKAEHISCYSLKVEEGTPFWNMELNLPDDDLVADMYDLAVEKLENTGYRRYEISNFAKGNKVSKHNEKYWQCDDFLGLGAGAFSCMDGKRFSNALGILEYIKKIEKNKSAEIMREDLSKFDLMSEFVFLGLRMTEGIREEEFSSRFGEKIDEVFGEALEKYIKTGHLIRENGNIRFSNEGFFVSNIILSDFV
ncbi:MAG: oxygen-independent coproporphyrinogen III oxidase [Clostridia bacterium]|nr:oxygen-independent coproporphyrinogen III oxidase [Clostridia bacterium]